MKRFVIFLTAVFVFLFLLPFRAEPDISAESAVVIEARTGIQLYVKNASVVLPMASTTKIMTALVAVENADLSAKITISERAAAVDGSQMGLFAGEIVSLEDLLCMLLMQSANDAAEAIAEGVCGSAEAFVEKMNERAASLGCVNTCFVNPHGLPDSGHYTTAEELAVIAAAAYANETVRGIVSSETRTLSYHGMVIENSNKLLSMYEYACGMKTGFTKVAGRCLVSAAEKDGITLIAVTLKAPDDWNDHIKLLDYAFSRVSLYETVVTGGYRASRPVLNGTERASFINTTPLVVLAIDGKPLYYEYCENLPVNVFAPVDAGKTYGSIVVKINGRAFFSSPLAAVSTVAEKYGELPFLSRFLNTVKKVFFLTVM